MTGENFYLTLPSNDGSKNYFLNNTNNSWKNKLASHIDLKGEWEVRAASRYHTILSLAITWKVSQTTRYYWYRPESRWSSQMQRRPIKFTRWPMERLEIDVSTRHTTSWKLCSTWNEINASSTWGMRGLLRFEMVKVRSSRSLPTTRAKRSQWPAKTLVRPSPIQTSKVTIISALVLIFVNWWDEQGQLTFPIIAVVGWTHWRWIVPSLILTLTKLVTPGLFRDHLRLNMWTIDMTCTRFNHLEQIWKSSISARSCGPSSTPNEARARTNLLPARSTCTRLSVLPSSWVIRRQTCCDRFVITPS